MTRFKHSLALAMCAAPLATVGCSTNHSTTVDDDPRHAIGSHTPSASPTAFMTGHWIHDDDGTVMEEIWFPPHAADGSTAGILRWTAPDGSVRMYELMSLSPTGDGTITFQLRHFRGDMSPWASEADGPFRGIVDRPEPNRLVIRCTERHGDVASITYERTGDALVSTLRFNESSGRDPIVIDFVLAD